MRIHGTHKGKIALPVGQLPKSLLELRTGQVVFAIPRDLPARARKPVICRFLAAALLLALSPLGGSAEGGAGAPALAARPQSGGEPVLSTSRQDGLLVTEGYIDIDQAPAMVSATLARLDDYHLWALRGLDGSGQAKRKVIGKVTAFDYLGGDRARVAFDVALPWPLGSSGNSAELVVTAGPGPGQMSFSSASPSPSYRRLELAFLALPGPAGGTRVSFRIRVEFSWYLDTFIATKGFGDGMSWRVAAVLRNLSDWLASSAG